MNAPDKIYLQVCGDCPLDRAECEKCRFVELEEITWSEEKIFDKDVEYIRKDLLLEWAKELTSEPYDRTTESARKYQIAHYLL